VEAGIVTSDALARVPAEIERSRTRFLIGDATAVPRSLGTFDLVVLANLLDRVGDPARCLAQMRDLVRPGGRLVISSPFTWMTEYTPRSKWLGGVRRGGREVQVHDSLLRLLRSDFALVRRVDVPFTIRDHARKYQWAVADATVWERR
jgi:SAM-dependent methyltransferase